MLIDYRRQKMAAKRGGGEARLTLAVDHGQPHDPTRMTNMVEVEALSTALERLDALDQRKAEIVKMRVVRGMTVPQVAEALEVSPSSVDRDWRFAKAWIADEVGLIGE